ncbi:MAG: monovalent cation:proton antiporter-2 (CPA2) family protein [Rickettsiales bacterium]
MDHSSTELTEIVILLTAAVLIVAVFRILRLSPVLGYLAAGTLIGPYGLGLIENLEVTSGIASFGVIFLLFLIGLELSFERLRSMRKHVFGFGGMQFFLTAGLFAAFFLGFGGNDAAAVIIGGGLALSSTAIVLQVVQEQGEKSSQIGRLALAILILQDLAVIPLLVLVTILADPSIDLSNALTEAGIKATICLVLIFTIGNMLLRPLFRFIASLENTELFTATTLFVALGVAWLTNLFGLSPALGAFMAGLLIAETEFKAQVESDILPYKGLFLGLFFMTVGMSLNIDTLLERFGSIIGLTIALMATKSLVIMALCRVFGFTLSSAIHVGLLLSQGSEFAFVLFSFAGESGLLDKELSQILLVVVTLSMALTPLIAEIGQRVATTLEKYSLSRPQSMLEETLDLSQHVIISGFGRVGHTVARLLEEERIPFVAIDMDSFLVAKERKHGIPVYYGDSTRMHVLNALGIARARAVVITHNDIRIALQTITVVRDVNKDIPIIVRAKNIEQVKRLEAAGANLAIAEMFETSLQLASALLKNLGVNDMEVTRIVDLFRAEDYALTRTAEKTVIRDN